VVTKPRRQPVRGISLTSEKPLNGQRVTAWLDNLLAVQGPDILRAKGIVDVAGKTGSWFSRRCI
jgi:G3E family GTPase